MHVPLWNDFDLTRLTLVWSGLACVAGFAISVAALTFVLIRLPPTYFQGPDSPRFWSARKPVLRWAGLAGKNLLGVALVGIGLVLALPGIPGQGVLTIFVGVMLLNFPGKRRLEQRVANSPGMLRAMNWLRTLFGRPPLLLDRHADADSPASSARRSQNEAYTRQHLGDRRHRRGRRSSAADECP